jgi:CRP/FNR family transcriptional regulator
MHHNGSSSTASATSGDVWTGLRREDVRVLDALSERHSTRKYPAHVELVSQGAYSREVLLLHDGIVKLVHTDDAGYELIVGLRFGPWVVGVAPALGQQAAVVSALTLTSCVVESVSIDHFVASVKRSPELLWAVAQLQALEALEHMGHAVDIACYSSRARLAHLLTRLAHAQKQAPVNRLKLTLPLKRGELASLIGVTPEHFSRLFRQFQDEGIVSVDKGWIVLQNVTRLRAEVTQWRSDAVA